MPTAFVTGVAGFIGSNLAESLVDCGYIVRGIDNLATGRRNNIETLESNDRFDYFEADIRDFEVLAETADGADYIFHQAAIPSVPRSVDDPVSTTDTNCTGTATVLEVARETGIESVIVASSSSVYGSTERLPKKEALECTPESPYALSKYYTESLALQYAELYELKTVALRYFNIFGPRQSPDGEYAAVVPKFINRMLEGDSPIIYGDGGQSRDFTYVDNAIQANILAAESDVTGEVFNIACGNRFTISELVSTLNELLHTDIEPRYAEPRPGDIRHSYADITKANQYLGYEPGISFKEGLTRTIEYFQS
jgi:UDP-glucose 4-epimerase